MGLPPPHPLAGLVFKNRLVKTGAPVYGRRIQIGVTQNPQYSQIAVLQNRITQKAARSRNFLGDSYNYQRGTTGILKVDMENLDNYLFHIAQAF